MSRVLVGVVVLAIALLGGGIYFLLSFAAWMSGYASTFEFSIALLTFGGALMVYWRVVSRSEKGASEFSCAPSQSVSLRSPHA